MSPASRHKRLLITIALFAILGICASFISQREKTSELPATSASADDGPVAIRSTPTAMAKPADHAAKPSAVASTQVRRSAAVKDAPTASELFRTAKECETAAESIEAVQSRAHACGDAAISNDPKWQEACAKDLIAGDAKMQRLLLQLDKCSADEHARDENYYQAMTDAARLGDTTAQLCWVEGYWHHSLEYEDYQSEAMTYVQNALTRGDWRFVALLAQNYIDNPPLSANLLVYADKPADGQINMSHFSFATYRMNRLLRLGATGEFARWTDMLSQTAFMSEDQIAAANAWAEQEYRTHFADQPKLDEVPESCDPSSMSAVDRDRVKHPWRSGGNSDQQ